ncbi:MAG: O-methyltransferase [Dermatophilaceae bacterium]
MSTPRAAGWAYADEFVAEPAIIAAARQRAEELGADSVAAGAGPVLRMIAAATTPKAVVEIGTGAGVSGLWLLAGMPADGVLTTIDVDAEHQRAARLAFGEAGIPHQRTRVIGGRALEVLGRMTDGAYDLAFVDGAPQEYPAYVEQVTRLLRPGGVLVIDGMFGRGTVADPAARDELTRTLRDLGKSLRDDEVYTSTVLIPVGDGLLVAVKH